MKILRINPFSALEKVVLDVTSDVPPLGLMDIGTQLLHKGTELFVKYSKRKNLSLHNMRHRSAINSISEYLNGTQLIRIMNDANRQFYFRSRFVLNFAFRYIRGIRTIDDFLNIFRGLRYLINK